MSRERISLAKWALAHQIPYRTAWGMAQRNQISGLVSDKSRRMWVETEAEPEPHAKQPEPAPAAPPAALVKAKPPRPKTLGERLDAMLESLEVEDSVTAKGLQGLMLQIVRDAPDDDPGLDTAKRMRAKIDAIGKLIDMLRHQGEQEGERETIALLQDIADRAQPPVQLPALGLGPVKYGDLVDGV